MKMMYYVTQRSAITTMSEKLSKFVLAKELQIYTIWTLASFQISIPIYIGCNFRRREIRIRRKCEGKIFPKGISRLATFLKQDDLKEILVNAEAKGIKTHKERDKKQFKEILPYINHWHLGLEANLLHYFGH